MFALVRQCQMLESGPDDLPSGTGVYGGAAVLVRTNLMFHGLETEMIG